MDQKKVTSACTCSHVIIIINRAYERETKLELEIFPLASTTDFNPVHLAKKKTHHELKVFLKQGYCFALRCFFAHPSVSSLIMCNSLICHKVGLSAKTLNKDMVELLVTLSATNDILVS